MHNKLVCVECGDFLVLERSLVVTAAEIIAFVDAHAGHVRLAVKLEIVAPT